MDEFILNGIKKLFKTLQMCGYIKDFEITNLYTISFINNLYNSKLYNYITDDDKQFLNNLVKCLAESSCTLQDQEIPELSLNTEINNAIITQIEEFILTQNNEVNVPIGGGTKKFTDFVFKPYMEIEDDMYLVGYDTSDQTETRVNVKDLGIFWE